MTTRQAVYLAATRAETTRKLVVLVANPLHDRYEIETAFREWRDEHPDATLVMSFATNGDASFTIPG